MNNSYIKYNAPFQAAEPNGSETAAKMHKALIKMAITSK